MKYLWRSLWLLLAFVFTACEALGVPPQTTVPPQGESNINTPLPPPTEQEQLTFPQMTETALAWPTVIYPTVSPPSLEEILQSSPYKTYSPNGNYVVVCDSSPTILLYVPTKSIIATSDAPFSCESRYMVWSADSSFGFYNDGDQTIYRWGVDGSPPEGIYINILPNPIGVDCDVKFEWSPDEKYLGILKACGLYVVKPDDESSFKNPIIVEQCGGCFDEFRWIAPRLMLVVYSKSLGIVHIPSGNWVAGISTSGGLCAAQIPLMSPDGRWVVSDAPWCGGGERGPNHSTIVNLEDGSKRIFSESFADRIDFVGWSQDGSKIYLVSRPTEIDALPDPRTPFGLLAMNPETLEVQNLFEQAWFVSFNKDFSWAYVIFPVKNDDGSLRLEGGLWEVGKSQLIGRQIMASSLDERFLEPVPYFTVQPFYSSTGEELGTSSTAAVRPVPAAWSHDNSKVATITPKHQLIIIDLQGDVQVIGQLNDNQEWLYSQITWSDDDKVLDVDEVKWAVP